MSQYVLKVHSRCDLACDHCYVYEHADQSWRQKPLAISADVVALAARRIAEHAAARDLAAVRIVLHGGEPLLLGLPRMRAVLAELRAQIASVTRLDLRLQTNGVRLDERWCELFDEYQVGVGISLDGDRAANDRHRRFAGGQSSHPQVRRALALLREPRYRHLYAGILCTIDISNDAVGVYEALLGEQPPYLDFLLPHATWASPPPRPAGETAAYARWLVRIYQRWVADLRPVPIRLFDSLISAVGGGPSWTEAVGLDPVDLLVIETDGSWEQADSLKTAYDGAPATGLDIFSDPVDAVAAQPGFLARQGGIAALAVTCQECPVVRICGGGMYAHRYRSGTGFDNPSVYCDDLKALIGHVVTDRARPGGAGLAAGRRPRAGHALPDGALTDLGSGAGSVAVIESLARMRRSVTRALVATVAAETSEKGGKGWRDDRLREAAEQGRDLLGRLDTAQPAAVQEVLDHPYTQAWAVRCRRRPAGSDPDLDRAHLAGLAAAAAVRAGITATVPVPVRDGRLYLPTIGALLAGPTGERTVAVSVRDGQLVTGAGTWELARRLGPGDALQVEDLDPFRDCQAWPAAGRLSDQDWLSWRHSLAGATARIADVLPSYAEAIGAGLRCVVPLRQAAAGDRSGTAWQAFGAVGLALPRVPDEMDALLLHEFQHVKMHALLDLHDLADAADRRRLAVPWRDDPRPLAGVLHGTYAHLALAQLFRARGPGQRDRYLHYQSWVRDGVTALAATGSLTPGGESFVAAVYAAAE